VTAWQIIVPWLVPMSLLLISSGLMSGSEAALFSLRDRELKQLARGNKAARLAANLLQKPEELLSGVLFWNLLVNLTYFTLVGIVGAKLEASPQAGAGVAVTFTVLNLLIVIFFSEMLPKSVAVLAPQRIATLCSIPVALTLKVVRPALPVVRIANLAVRRLIWPGFVPEPEIDLDAIGRAIDLGTGDTALAMREQTALKNLVQLAELRADQCMRPRSTLPVCSAPITPEDLRQAFSMWAEGSSGPGYLLVLQPDSDHIVGSLNIDQLRPSQVETPTAAIEPVCYVPWSTSVSKALDLLQKQRLSVAIVVNEFGDTIGMLSTEDIVHQILTGRFEHQNSGDAT
jgi:putative hemolysin